jgi:hypothetical protein
MNDRIKLVRTDLFQIAYNVRRADFTNALQSDRFILAGRVPNRLVYNLTMLGFGPPSPIAEYEASGELDDLYHDILQTFRVSGINLLFRRLAGYGPVLPILWQAMKPAAETRAFETAADHIRSQATNSARAMNRLNARPLVRLGESQQYQIQAALKLYHYVNPKLLTFVSSLLETWHETAEKSHDPGGPDSGERIERGIPSGMYPMDMVSEQPADERLQSVFEDIKQTFSLTSINSDYHQLSPQKLHGRLNVAAGRSNLP